MRLSWHVTGASAGNARTCAASGATRSAITRLVCWKTARRRGCNGSAACASRATASIGTGRGSAGRIEGLLEDAPHLGADAVQLLAMGFRQHFEGVFALFGEAQMGDTTVTL